MLQAVLDDLVGEDIQLLLVFPLDISMTRPSQNIDQAGPPDRGRDNLGRERDVVEEIGQLPGRFRVAILLIQDEPLDRGH